MMKRQAIFIFLLTFNWALASAQPGGGPGGGDPGHGKPVPLAGIEILLCIGAFFGTKRILDLRKKSK